MLSRQIPTMELSDSSVPGESHTELIRITPPKLLPILHKKGRRRGRG
jgi:hypothetical protein